jgi:hypothetical protein
VERKVRKEKKARKKGKRSKKRKKRKKVRPTAVPFLFKAIVAALVFTSEPFRSGLKRAQRAAAALEFNFSSEKGRSGHSSQI